MYLWLMGSRKTSGIVPRQPAGTSMAKLRVPRPRETTGDDFGGGRLRLLFRAARIRSGRLIRMLCRTARFVLGRFDQITAVFVAVPALQGLRGPVAAR